MNGEVKGRSRILAFFFWPGIIAFAIGVIAIFSAVVFFFSREMYHLNSWLIELTARERNLELEMAHLVAIQSWLATLLGFLVAIAGFFLSERIKNNDKKIAIHIAGETVLHAKKTLIDNITSYQGKNTDLAKQDLLDEISALRSALSNFDMINSRFSTLKIRLAIGEFYRQIESEDKKYFIRHKNTLIREIERFLVKIGLDEKEKEL